MRKQLELDNVVAAELAGSNDSVLRTLEGHLDCDVFLRGNVVTLDGSPDAVSAGEAVIGELSELIAAGHEIAPGTIEAVTGALDRHESPGRILEDVVWRYRNTKVAPKTVNQKRYVDSIRTNTVTFGIGPAGTGKTFLAVALAAAALSRREVNRIILTRPAVEAGERLGFLPGDMMAKVDPYLRPLFDALNDMMDPERVAQHLNRGVIEVAPLAFMRGRAQPLSAPVVTPYGVRPIGSLRVGDLVIGSDGRPTPVLGVYPQGRKEVFRVRAQDGASTLCCGEHLWSVARPEDLSAHGPDRIVETREMMRRLQGPDPQRFELPLVQAPVEFEPRPTPMDPYALGLLLGDRLPPTGTAPRAPAGDDELATALGGAVADVELLRPSSVDELLRRAVGDPRGTGAAGRGTAVLRELGGAGTASSTRFVPDPYLYNGSGARLAVLQGLLDSGGAPVMERGGACRIQYATCSRRLRDDVTFLVRSLGGVASTGGDAGLDIRLPSHVEPFRRAGKRAHYRPRDGGRPKRFVEAIEPAGETPTVCIQVAAADSLYATEDFLLTHNTLNDSFVILDEAQNTSPEQMKMFLTRLGFNSKMVVTGDITQIDLPRDQRSGLVVVGEILESLADIDFVRFGGEDVVRHKLVQRIVEAYGAHGEPARRPSAVPAPELRRA